MLYDSNSVDPAAISKDSVQADNPPRLLDQVRNVIRCKHYSFRTVQSYIDWIRRYIYFHDKKHPKTLNEMHISSFLTHLAVDRKVAASTQNQALCAIVFLMIRTFQLVSVQSICLNKGGKGVKSPGDSLFDG